MTNKEKLAFIKNLDAGRYKGPSYVKAELVKVIDQGSIKNNNFPDDMRVGILYGLLWAFGYDYSEAMKLARELVK